MARSVLLTTPMQRLGLGLAFVLASTTVASAGTYVGLGIGSETTGGATRDGMDLGTMDGYGRSGRLMVGTRISKLSVEGQGSRFNATLDHASYQATQLALAAKLSIPVGNNFEVFARAGLERTWLSQGPTLQHDAAGSGLLLGGGLEYRLNLGLTAASIFVDYQRANSAFTNDYMVSWDGVTSMYTLGATVSL